MNNLPICVMQYILEMLPIHSQVNLIKTCSKFFNKLYIKRLDSAIISVSCLNLNKTRYFAKLEYLKVRNTCLCSVYEFTQSSVFKNLKVFIYKGADHFLSKVDFTDCRITHLSVKCYYESMTKLKYLQHLVIKYNMVNITQNLVSLAAVIYFNKQKNIGISSINIKHMSNLRKFVLKGFKVIGLEYVNLTEFYCEERYQGSISHMTNLRKLIYNIRQSDLSNLPNLKYLVCKNIRIDSISNLPKLKFLDCSFSVINKIENVPKLKTLIAAELELNNIELLPKSIKALNCYYVEKDDVKQYIKNLDLLKYIYPKAIKHVNTEKYYILNKHYTAYDYIHNVFLQFIKS